MPEKHLFEYAVIRIVPRVEREEFLNVGVILYCKSLRFLQCIYNIDEQRILAFYAKTDIQQIIENLQAFKRICQGGKGSGPIGGLDLASRFRWLTAARSTVVQTSRVHPGFCTDADETLKRLLEQYAG